MKPADDSPDYLSWLNSPFGEVHRNAAEAVRQRPMAEIQALLDHFDKWPELREGISVASRCGLGWFDREGAGPIDEPEVFDLQQSMKNHLHEWSYWIQFVKHTPNYEFKSNKWRKKKSKAKKIVDSLTA